MSEPETDSDLTAAARLFGRLLLRELDAATLDELDRPAVRAALEALEIEVPTEDRLPALGSEYFECFLHPTDSSPPVQSLFREGNYNGDASVAVARIAAAAGRERAAGARNAPVDHLGCILLLWGELRHERPELAALLARDHLGWAERALLPIGARSGFYASIARATISLIANLRSMPA